MPELKLSDIDAEECLVASLLLHDPDFSALDLVADEDCFYDHLRPIVSTIRALRARGKPVGTVTVLYALEPILDSLEWRGDRGEVMILELLSRRMFDPNCWYAPAMASVIHAYAERRKALAKAQEAAKQTFQEVLESERVRYEGEMR